MGGDGGTISSNRTYLRGAGKACHTADHPSNALKRSKLEDAERARSILSVCAASGAPLDFSPDPGRREVSVSGADIVACPYGKLYRREKALEALLQRSRAGGGGAGAPGAHVRGMKDLHPVRFHVVAATSSSSRERGDGPPGSYAAACPITGSDISSGHVPSFVIVRAAHKSKDEEKKSDDDNDDGGDAVARGPNVLSERAIKEMGVEGLQAEYGPFEEKDLIRLAPPKTGGVLEGIQRRWEARMEEARIAKLKRKKDKKRKSKKGGGGGNIDRSTKLVRRIQSSDTGGRGGGDSTTTTAAVDEARSAVRSAVAQNPVLSSLFGAGKEDRRTEKKKKEDLFTRNC